MAILTADEIGERLKSLDGWSHVSHAIRKEFTFEGFPDAVLFVSALVPSAEDADHHPDIEIHYKRVVLTYTTHSERGVTQKDIDGAVAADEVARQMPHLTGFGDG